MSYTRQSSFSNGDVVDADALNNEYDQLAVTFDTTTGHRHNGEVGEGDFVPLIKEKVSDTSVVAGTEVINVTLGGIANILTFSKDAQDNLMLNGILFTTFSVDGHSHAIGDITGLQSELDSKYSSNNQPTWDDVQGKPDFSESDHVHSWDSIQSKPTTFPPSAHTHPWGEVTGKPATFTPSSHTHSIGDVTNLQTTLDSKISTVNNSILEAPASLTIARENHYTVATVVTDVLRTFTLNNPTFLVGDIVDIDVQVANSTGVTIITSSGTIRLPDGTSGTSHVLTAAQAVVRLYKISSTDWRVRVFN